MEGIFTVSLAVTDSIYQIVVTCAKGKLPLSLHLEVHGLDREGMAERQAQQAQQRQDPVHGGPS